MGLWGAGMQCNKAKKVMSMKTKMKMKMKMEMEMEMAASSVPFIDG